MSMVMPELMAFPGKSPVVAFNAGFDVPMIEFEARRLNIPFRITKWVDLMGPSMTYYRHSARSSPRGQEGAQCSVRREFTL